MLPAVHSPCHRRSPGDPLLATMGPLSHPSPTPSMQQGGLRIRALLRTPEDGANCHQEGGGLQISCWTLLFSLELISKESPYWEQFQYQLVWTMLPSCSIDCTFQNLCSFQNRSKPFFQIGQQNTHPLNQQVMQTSARTSF